MPGFFFQKPFRDILGGIQLRNIETPSPALPCSLLFLFTCSHVSQEPVNAALYFDMLVTMELLKDLKQCLGSWKVDWPLAPVSWIMIAPT